MANNDYSKRFARSDLFFPYQIEKMKSSDINKEYSRLRSIANKRIERLAKQGLTKHVTKFATIQQIKDSSKWDVGSQLAEVSRFLRDPRVSTVTGVKQTIRDTQDTLREMGYGSLVKTVEQTLSTIDFLESVREQYINTIYKDSGDALDVLEQGQRLNIPTDKLLENYELFASNLDKLEKIKPSSKGTVFSQRRINNLISKWSKN